MEIEVVSRIEDIESIAVRHSIHDLAWLRRTFGAGRWRKLKGVAMVRLPDGEVVRAEVHWYEAHGIGRRGLKMKRRLEP